jgi:hypothetical protein
MATVRVSGDAIPLKKTDERAVNPTAFKLWETSHVEKRDGTVITIKKLWTIWSDQVLEVTIDPAALGKTWVEVEGELTTKISEYEKDGEKKLAVEHSINKARLIQVKPSATVAEAAGFWNADIQARAEAEQPF